MKRTITGKWAVLAREAPGSAEEARRVRMDTEQMRRASEKIAAYHRRLDPPLVLVVDDDPDLLDLLTVYLEREGARVMVAGSAAAAREVMSNGARPDLVLSDYRMPGGDGLALLRDARNLQPQATRALMSGGGGADGVDIEGARRDGVLAGFLPKIPDELPQLAAAALALLA